MKIELEIDGRLRKLDLHPQDNGSYTVELDGRSFAVDAHLLRPGILSLLIEGRAFRCVLEHGPAEPAIHLETTRIIYRIEDPRSLKSRRAHLGAADGPRPIKAPMPGRVVRLLAAAGDQVEANQGILVIEAMKMQNELKAPKAGRVSGLRVAPGDTVSAGDVLAVIE
ncbi:acetyl-CoA carboxylase biotin carboxyl carrier protein subunit [Acidipila rosea]|uniref:Biotin carboxyl carrier protein n=1 Tax=Acidipila rosea TaxID=768535 RepID=A0A4V2PUS9_9BACT|nr:acetyl-CoA carboxylase biotin carboxyl carrier protein subunit [Acidipila rosea]TCK71711.1 biotin carboxyl carrier protein [Acidipila rosea]